MNATVQMQQGKKPNFFNRCFAFEVRNGSADKKVFPDRGRPTCAHAPLLPYKQTLYTARGAKRKSGFCHAPRGCPLQKRAENVIAFFNKYRRVRRKKFMPAPEKTNDK